MLADSADDKVAGQGGEPEMSFKLCFPRDSQQRRRAKNRATGKKFRRDIVYVLTKPA